MMVVSYTASNGYDIQSLLLGDLLGLTKGIDRLFTVCGVISRHMGHMGHGGDR
jgi:hypothetical protein